VQAGGLVLLVFGGLIAAFTAPALWQGGQTMQPLGPSFATMPGGDVEVRILKDGVPRENMTVVLLAWNGTESARAATSASGWANLSLGAEAVGHVHVVHNGSTWNRTVVALEDTRVQVRIDVGQDALSSDRWPGLEAFDTVVRVLAGVIGILALLMAAGGVAALRVRGRPWAVAGVVAAVVPVLLAVFAVPVMGLLLLLPIAIAGWVIIRNRDAFPR